MLPKILLRDVIESDLKIFFEQERCPTANLMAAFPARDEKSFLAHWKKKVLIKTIIYDENVVGSIES